MKELIRWNKAAFVLHATSFVASAFITSFFRNGSVRGVITNDFTSHVATYQLLWVDLPFPFITAFFHGMIAYNPWFQRIYLTTPGSPLRWAEYAQTASFMTWVLLQLVQVQDVFLLILAGPVANICLQAQGYLQERFAKTRIPTLIGWFIFTFQWLTIWLYYAYMPNKPWFVHSAIIGSFIGFCAFGLVQLSRAPKLLQEKWFIGLSFTSKLYLTWTLLIATIVQ